MMINNRIFPSNQVLKVIKLNFLFILHLYKHSNIHQKSTSREHIIALFIKMIFNKCVFFIRGHFIGGFDVNFNVFKM